MASIDKVQDVTPRVQFTALASQTIFAYPFPIFVDADIVVDVDGVLKVLTTDYTVSGAGADTGGNVTFLVAPGVGKIVTIFRDIAVERLTDFQQNGPWSSVTFNDELDKFILILQELENKVGRAIRFPITSASTNAQAEMAPISNFKAKFLRITSAGILEAADLLSNVVAFTAETIGVLINPQTAGELAAAVTPTAFRFVAYDVRRYGAVGDGVADDTVAIQQAIDSVEAQGGGDVRLPDGTYLVNNTLTINGPVWLRGEGASFEEVFTASPTFNGSVIKLANGAFNSASKPIVLFDYTGTGPEARLHAGASNILVFGNRGTGLDPTVGPANKDINSFGIGFQTKGARYITLDHCHAVWCAEDGFQAISDGGTPTNNLRIIGGSYLSNADDGIDFSGGDSFVTDVQCGFNGGDGIACAGGLQIKARCWDNFENGLRITASDVSVLGDYHDNERAGILVSGTLERIVILLAICQDNGKDTGLTDQERSGIFVSGNSNGSIIGVTSGNKDETGTTGQKYGVRVVNTSAKMVVAGISGEDNGIALVSDLGAGSFNCNKLDASGDLNHAGPRVITGTPQLLTGPGAVGLTQAITHIATTGADALTLADGTEGQEKFIVMKTDGGIGTLTPANLGNGTTITFDDVGDSAQLLFTNAAWHFMGGTATLA